MLYLHGAGHHHPDTILDNAFFETLDIGTAEDWILSRVGIRERRTVLPLDYIRETKNRDPRGATEAATMSNAETGRRAAEMALSRAGISADDVGMVIAGSASPDRCVPGEAGHIAKALGIDKPAFDVQSACTTFGLHMHVASSMGEALPDFVLVVAPENLTRMINFADRASCVIFGDGTSAVVVSPRVPARAKIVHASFGGSSAGAGEIDAPRLGHVWQNGTVVQRFAIKKMTDIVREMQARRSEAWGQEGHSYFIGHQANLRILESTLERCAIPAERHLSNIVHFGNQSSAGAPAVLSQNWERFQAGDRVAMVVVGAGLSWSSVEIDFD